MEGLRRWWQQKLKGRGKGQGQQALVRWRADLLKIAELMAGGNVGRGESVVDDILVVSDNEGERARRMAVGPGQQTALNVLAAAMKSIFSEVHRIERTRVDEDNRGGRGREQGQQCTHRRVGTDGQGRERAGGDVGG